MINPTRTPLSLVEQPDCQTSASRAHPTGFTTADGQPIRLGDVVRQSTARGYFEFIVTHQEVDRFADEDTAGYCLRGWREVADGVLNPLARIVEMSEFAARDMTVVGNIFEAPEQYIPAHTYYCYTGLRIEDGHLVSVRCPFWESTRHGMAHCRMRNTKSLDQSAPDAYTKAVGYYNGNDEDVDAFSDDFLVCDQVKECGHSADHVEIE